EGLEVRAHRRFAARAARDVAERVRVERLPGRALPVLRRDRPLRRLLRDVDRVLDHGARKTHSDPDPKLAAMEDTSRLETFSDGIFAIAATLLILEVHRAGGSVSHGLMHAWPSYTAYAISFLTIGIIWVNHHTVMNQIDRVDRRPACRQRHLPLLRAGLSHLRRGDAVVAPLRLRRRGAVRGDRAVLRARELAVRPRRLKQPLDHPDERARGRSLADHVRAQG